AGDPSVREARARVDITGVHRDDVGDRRDLHGDPAFEDLAVAEPPLAASAPTPRGPVAPDRAGVLQARADGTHEVVEVPTSHPDGTVAVAGCAEPTRTTGAPAV